MTIGESCIHKESKEFPKVGSFLNDSVLYNAKQVIPNNENLFIVRDFSIRTGRFKPYIFLYDKNLKLKSVTKITSHKIDSIVNDTIYITNSDNISPGFLSYNRLKDDQFVFKSINSSIFAAGGMNISNKLVSKLSFVKSKGKIWIYFFECANKTIGLDVPKQEYSKSFFSDQFSKFDSLSLNLFDIKIDYTRGLIEREYISERNTFIHEQFLVANDSIFQSLFRQLVTYR